MLGDPHKYREHAKTCLHLAAEASSAFTKERLEALAYRWMKLASEQEAVQSLLKEVNEAPEPPPRSPAVVP